MRRLGKLLILLAFLIIPRAILGEKLFIPPIYELRGDLKKQSECNRKLEIDNCLALVEIGLLEPGEVDLNHPNVRFQLAYNRWIRLWNKSVEQGSVDYQEVIAFERVVKSFEKFVDRVEKERKGVQ